MYDDADDYGGTADQYLFRNMVSEFVARAQTPPFQFADSRFGIECREMVRRYIRSVSTNIGTRQSLSSHDLDSMVERASWYQQKEQKLVPRALDLKQARAKALEVFDNISALPFFDFVEEYGNDVIKTFPVENPEAHAEQEQGEENDDEVSKPTYGAFEIDIERYAAQCDGLWQDYLAQNPNADRNDIKRMNAGVKLRLLMQMEDKLLDTLRDTAEPKGIRYYGDVKEVKASRLVLQQRAIEQLEAALRKPFAAMPADTEFGRQCNRLARQTWDLTADRMAGKSMVTGATLVTMRDEAQRMVIKGMPRFADTADDRLDHAIEWTVEKLPNLPFAQFCCGVTDPKEVNLTLGDYCRRSEQLKNQYRALHPDQNVEEEFSLFEDIMRLSMLDFATDHVDNLIVWECRTNDRRRDTLPCGEMKRLVLEMKQQYRVPNPDSKYAQKCQAQRDAMLDDLQEMLSQTDTLGRDDFEDLLQDASLRAGRTLAHNNEETAEQMQDVFHAIQQDPAREPFIDFIAEYVEDDDIAHPHEYIIHRDELQAAFREHYHEPDIEQVLRNFDENMQLSCLQLAIDEAAQRFERQLTLVPERGR